MKEEGSTMDDGRQVDGGQIRLIIDKEVRRVSAGAGRSDKHRQGATMQAI